MELKGGRLGLNWAILGPKWIGILKDQVGAQIGQVAAQTGHSGAYADLFGTKTQQVEYSPLPANTFGVGLRGGSRKLNTGS